MGRWIMVVAMAGMAGAVGCTSKLESGYTPRKLSASPAERRGFYADPFTPEARAAMEERQDEFDARRPGPRY